MSGLSPDQEAHSFYGFLRYIHALFAAEPISGKVQDGGAWDKMTDADKKRANCVHEAYERQAYLDIQAREDAIRKHVEEGPLRVRCRLAGPLSETQLQAIVERLPPAQPLQMAQDICLLVAAVRRRADLERHQPMTIKTPLPQIPTPSELSGLSTALTRIIAKLVDSLDAGSTPIDISGEMNALSTTVRERAQDILQKKGWEVRYTMARSPNAKPVWAITAPTTRAVTEEDFERKVTRSALRSASAS